MPTAPNTLPAAQQPAPAVRALVSILIILHVLAVFIGPWAMPPQNSELQASFARLFQPYLESMGLANGYRFFAPEPGPSHLVRYEVTLPNGSEKQGAFPDRRLHKPRLLYHRYFMLSEFINTLENPNAPHDRAESYAKSYAHHLAHLYGGTQVKLYLRRHFVPRMSEAREGMRLTDERLYEERPLGTFSERGDP